MTGAGAGSAGAGAGSAGATGPAMLSAEQRAALAGRLARARRPSAQEAAQEPVVPLGAGAGRQPMFLVHSVGGTAFGYAHLARALAGDFQVYGVEADGLASGSRPAPSLDAMVARYAGAIRRTQPTGPYTLGGWSFGGLVAFETARLLERRGERVDRLVLIDTACRPYRPADHELRRCFVVDVVRSLGWDGVSEFAVDDDGFALLARRLADPGADTADGDTADADTADGDTALVRADLERRFALFDAHLRVVDGYRPAGTVRTRALVVCAAGSPNAAMDWAGAIDGPVRELRVAGDHYRCLLPPYPEEIAAAVRTL